MRICLKVVPGASRDEITGWLGDRLKVRVRAPAEHGKANAAVIRLLATSLGVPRHALSMVTGAASPYKVLEVEVLSETEARQRLARSGSKAASGDK
jgi:uncharacterized protein (TIGR00251 family)